ncbi:MAG: hypothetical protein DRP42_07325 [Tenericutes bacterium]|nr:MAG: hypothetical protein DRP42_07325 [Mycoplasmatota bacterium]
MTNNEQYRKLIEYLQNQEHQVINTGKHFRKTTFETKDLIDKSGFHTLSFQQLPKSTNGFDVSKLESLMRSRLIEQFIKSQEFERPYISVTEICTCLRKSYYVRKKYSVDLKRMFSFSYLYLIQRVGESVHKVIQEIFGFSEVEKTIISEKYQVKGRVDAISNNVLYEIKTVDSVKFDSKKKPTDFYNQANVYAYILNNEYNYDISTINIVCVSRNLKEVFPYDFTVNRKAAEAILTRAMILKSCLENENIPDPYGASKKECDYCNYRNYCQQHKCEKVLQPFSKDSSKVSKQDSKTDKVAFLL